MSIALVIRNINPNRQDNAQLVVVTLSEQQAGQLPAEFETHALSPIAQAPRPSCQPPQPVAGQGQLYWFPQKPNKYAASPLGPDGQDCICPDYSTADYPAPHYSGGDDPAWPANRHPLAAGDYVWCCTLDQAG